MSNEWLDLGLDGLPTATAQRIRLCRLTLANASLLRNRLDRELAPSGITSQQAAMLQFIEAQGAPPTISHVAEGMSMSHQNVTQIAKALEAKSFLTIEADRLDRRVRRLSLTAHHYRFWKQRNRTDFAEIERWTSELSDKEISAAVSVLTRLRLSLRC